MNNCITVLKWTANFMVTILYCLAIGLGASCIMMGIISYILDFPINDWQVFAIVVSIVFIYDIVMRRPMGLKNIFMLPFPKVGL